MKTISLVNNRGQSVEFPETITLKELVKLGVMHIGLRKPADPLPDDWYTTMEPSDTYCPDTVAEI
jgi:hypothetical protein